jgi:hypothetical protein
VEVYYFKNMELEITEVVEEQVPH